MLKWIRSQYAHSSAYPFRNWEANHKPRLLSLDVYKGQLNDTVLAKFKRIDCTYSFITSGTTGLFKSTMLQSINYSKIGLQILL